MHICPRYRRQKARFHAIIAGLFCLCLPPAAHAQTTDSWNLYNSYTTSYTIPYTTPPNYQTGQTGLFVAASVDGSTPLTFQVDTGSQGMVVPQYLIPGFVQAPVTQQQKIEYSSSGNYSLGTWATETITFPGSHDANGDVATATLPVLVESESVTNNGSTVTDCSRQGAACTTLMGVGYGRPDTGWGPNYLPSLINNPLLNLPGMANGTVRAGYIITSTGIEAGLTAANAGSGYAYIQLQPDTTLNEVSPNWQTLPGTVLVNGSTVQSGGGVLLDSGISYSWADLGSAISAASVTCAANASFQCAPANTQVTVYLGGTNQIGYTYTVDGTGNSTAAPWYMRVDGGGAMNTGVHPYSVFNYVFDAAGGFVGLQQSGLSAPGVVFSPYLSTMGDLALPGGFSTNLPINVRGASTIQPAGAATLQGDITGPGALTFAGPGQVLVSGNVTLPAGVAVTGGTVTFSGTTTAPLAISAGAVTVNLGTINGDITNAGSLDNNGAISGAVTNTGTLSGNGSLGTLDVKAGGVVSPGNSIGLIKVTGNAVFEPGAIHLVQLGSNGVSDRLLIGGTLTAAGAMLYLVPTTGFLPQLGAAYNIVKAAAINSDFTLVTPYFGSATAPYPFLAAGLTDSGTTETITLTRSAVSFTSFTQTANETNAAAAADTLAPTAPLLQTLAGLPAAAVPSSFNILSGQAYASYQSGLLADSFYVRDAVNTRLRQATAPALTGPAAPRTAPLGSTKLVLWEQSYGGWTHYIGNTNAAAMGGSIGGFMLGLDGTLNGWRAGLAGGFSQSSYTVNELAANATSNNYDFAAYTGRSFAPFGPGQWALNFGGAYSWHGLSTHRAVNLPNLQENFSPNTQARTGQLFGELGYGMPLNIAQLEPFAGLSYANVTTNGFSEGTGSAALTAQSANFSSVDSTIGFRSALPVKLGTWPALTASATIGWQHDFSALTPTTEFAYAAGSLPFAAYGTPLAANTALVSAGISGKLANADLSLFYTGQLSPQQSENGLQGTVTWHF